MDLLKDVPSVTASAALRTSLFSHNLSLNPVQILIGLDYNVFIEYLWRIFGN